jgi:hypothetical protein
MDLFALQLRHSRATNTLSNQRPAAVHADAHALGFQLVGKRHAGELCPLVGLKISGRLF